MHTYRQQNMTQDEFKDWVDEQLEDSKGGLSQELLRG